jgi:hypothetical protein
MYSLYHIIGTFVFYKFVKGILMSVYVWSGSYRQMYNLHVTVETDSRNDLGFNLAAKVRLLSLIGCSPG